MSKHQVLIDSGFGSYLVGRRPSAVGNAFLYDEPTLLLWTDEILCDRHALAGERQLAKDGWLASQLFVRLEEAGVVRGEAFEHLFPAHLAAEVTAVSQRDFEDALKVGRAPTSTIEPDRIADFGHNGFYDINAFLFVSQLLGIPFVDVKQTQRYYSWKLGRVAAQAGYSSRTIIREAVSIMVPSFQLCPQGTAFREANNATRKVFRSFELWTRGKTDETAYRKSYTAFLDAWRRYDDLARTEALDRLELLIETRRDARLRSLRALAARVAEAVRTPTDDPSFPETVGRHVRQEILEVERELANRSKAAATLDKCASYVSPPLEIGGLVGGLVGAAITSNPIFVVAGILPRTMNWASRRILEGRGRKRAWYFFMLDFRTKVERRRGLRMIEEELRRPPRRGRNSR